MELTDLTIFGVPIWVWILVVCVVGLWTHYSRFCAEMRKQDAEMERAWRIKAFHEDWERKQKEKADAVFEAEHGEQIREEVAKIEARIAASRKLPPPLPSSETPVQKMPP